MAAATTTAESAPFHLGYRRWLDGLRGWAILFVLAFHLGLLPGGSLGVDAFFVLSGFLITTLLVEEWQRRGSISLRHFYLRRALRLFPALFTLLLLYGVTSLRLPRAEAIDHLWEIVVAGCYISNWHTLHGVNLTGLGHTWSLSVEEQFYLLWPAALCVMLALRLSRRRMLQIVGAGIVACVVLRIGMYQTHRGGSAADKAAIIARMCLGLDTRADSLLVGCLVGLVVTAGALPQSRRFLRASSGAALVAVVALTYLALFSAQTQTAYFHGLFTIVALMVACIIVHMLVAPSRVATLLLECAPVVGAGRISYGLYLYHMVIIHWMQPGRLGSWHQPGTSAIIALLSLAAALASYYCVERPCLRLKDRFGHQRAPVAPAESQRAPRAAA